MRDDVRDTALPNEIAQRLRMQEKSKRLAADDSIQTVRGSAQTELALNFVQQQPVVWRGERVQANREVAPSNWSL